MARRSIKISVKARPSAYSIAIGPGILNEFGEWARAIVPEMGRIAVVSNPKAFGIYGEQAAGRLEKAGFSVSSILIGDGERHKNFRTLEKVLRHFGEAGLKRTDTVLALGGGVVGDLAGFAASVYMRGIRLLQVPTTLLSMIDSSVGGKTAVNTEFGKNMAGTFYQPAGVLIDPAVLRTLPERELTAGLCEAVKQAAIAGGRLFSATERFLARPERTFDDEIAAGLIAAHVSFKAKIVRADEREDISRTDSKSRKILNFGHTFAHAIENLTGYKYFRHGEAVGHGIIYAAELSKKLELIGKDEVNLLNDVVRRAGALPAIRGIDPADIVRQFGSDKKVAGRSLRWVLLEGIGKPVIVPGEDIPPSVLKRTAEELIRR